MLRHAAVPKHHVGHAACKAGERPLRRDRRRDVLGDGQKTAGVLDREAEGVDAKRHDAEDFLEHPSSNIRPPARWLEGGGALTCRA